MRNNHDPKRCKERVHCPSGWGMNQCSRKHVRDGYCKQHHPDAVAERRAATDARYRFESARRAAPYEKIAKLEDRVKELEELLEEANLKLNCEHDECSTRWVGEPATGGPDPVTVCDHCGQVIDEVI